MKLDIKGNQVTIDATLYANLMHLKDAVDNQNFDDAGIIDGPEGSGKSKLGELVATVLDPSYNIDRCCFTPDQFMHAVLTAEKGQAIVFDESYQGASSRGSMSSLNKNLINLLTQCRCRNLHVIFILPSFFDADRYLALWRARWVAHVYLGQNLTRGQCAFYGYEKKKRLYILCKKFYTYGVRPDFRCRFGNYDFIDGTAYDKKKLESFALKTKGGLSMPTDQKQDIVILYNMLKEAGLSDQKIKKRFNEMRQELAGLNIHRHPSDPSEKVNGCDGEQDDGQPVVGADSDESRHYP